MAMTQAESYEPFWRKHRDDWRACTPDDVHGLREDRTFEPPSKAHRKRLARPRPVVTLAAPRPAADTTRRREINQAHAAAAPVRAAMRIRAHHAAPIEPDTRWCTERGDPRRLADDHAEQRRAAIERECARIARFGCDELSRAWALWIKR